jgi:hypothetical protein
MKNIVMAVVLARLAGSSAWASNIYSVAYEGGALPENRPGWYRAYGGGGAIRTIETDPDDPNNHFLVINSLADQMIFDYAYCPRQMDPEGPNERFYAEWRVLISESYGAPDQSVGFASDQANQVGFSYYQDRIYDGFDGWFRAIEPGIFHTYRLESADMVSYTLWIDGEFARQAQWFEGVLYSRASFGDGGQYGESRSLGKWDYFRFGVAIVPEPTTIFVLVGLCAGGVRRRG